MNKHKKFISRKVVVEILILLVFPYPYIDTDVEMPQETLRDDGSEAHYVTLCYKLSEFLYLFMFTRLVFVLRALFNLTPYLANPARLYCARHGVSANVRFSFKCILKTNPLQLIFCILVPSFFLFAVFLRVFERPYTDISLLDFQSYLNAVWCCAVTMSTIGYGDVFPSTNLGRAIAVLCSMWGVVTFSMILYALETNLYLSRPQNKAFTEIQRSKTGIRVIVAGLTLNIIKSKHGWDSELYKEQKRKLEKCIISHKFANTGLRSVSTREESAEISMEKHYKKLKMQMNRLETKLNMILDHIR